MKNFRTVHKPYTYIIVLLAACHKLLAVKIWMSQGCSFLNGLYIFVCVQLLASLLSRKDFQYNTFPVTLNELPTFPCALFLFFLTAAALRGLIFDTMNALRIL
jgi:prepilin signal peptidase PulO-like enzyme (type II secretory pathway)